MKFFYSHCPCPTCGTPAARILLGVLGPNLTFQFALYPDTPISDWAPKTLDEWQLLLSGTVTSITNETNKRYTRDEFNELTAGAVETFNASEARFSF